MGTYFTIVLAIWGIPLILLNKKISSGSRTAFCAVVGVGILLFFVLGVLLK